MSKLHGIRPFLICGLMIVFASEALAQAQRATPSQDPPPVDRSGSIQARKKIADAQSDVTKAQAALTEVVTKLRTDFEAGKDWQDAQAALKQAQMEFEVAKKPVIEAVKMVVACVCWPVVRVSRRVRNVTWRAASVAGSEV